ncbi:hypothetical protein [Shewanella sp. NIFS-20-20]|uniref:hypothetical protein n=1 Tax=Shewanella sp. NIFS-20-20 TaxID=2853806 RepID=UPI001C47C875|nr:hypothetical protein [Shewanella sp. NIFS-20-20]MBV7315473.1 hypothetical protein [Shewanella sp. NIFS-20-20]
MTKLTKQPLISKPMWKALEAELAGGWVNVAFRYKGYEVSIARVRQSESKTCLSVYIDGVIEGAWISRLDKQPDDAPSILRDVWKLKSIAKYKPKMIADIEKIYGKRRAKKECPDLHQRIEYLLPYFAKASVLCSQFKKLDGLALIKADCLTAANSGGEA